MFVIQEMCVSENVYLLVSWEKTVQPEDDSDLLNYIIIGVYLAVQYKFKKLCIWKAFNS